MDTDQPELSPDLEWMLRSSQAGDDLVLEALVNEAYQPVFRLAISLLDHPAAAHRAALQTLRLALNNRHRYRSDLPVRAWLFSLAIPVCRRRLAGLSGPRALRAALAPAHPLPGDGGPPPQTEREARLWLALDALPHKLSLPLKLHAVHGLPAAEISRCLQVPPAALPRRLEAARRALLARLAPDRPSLAELDGLLGESLGRRWPELDLPPGRLPALLAELQGRPRPGTRARPGLPLRRAFLTGLGLAAMLGVAGLSSMLFPGEPAASLTVRTALVTRGVQITATPQPVVDPPGAGPAPHTTGLGAGENRPAALSGLPIRSEIDLPPAVIDLTVENPPDEWKNSGPILLARLLQYWGQASDLNRVTRSLQPNPLDSNVMPYELERYVEEQTSLKAVYRLGGDFPILARLIQAGFPVLLQKGYTGRYTEGWQGHYAVASGYDQTAGTTVLLTTSIGFEPRSRLAFTHFNRDWRAFDYGYLIVYPEDREVELAGLLGAQVEPAYNYRQAVLKVSAEIYYQHGWLNQFYAWFNRGTSLTYLEDYLGAAEAYDQAFSIYTRLPAEDRPQRLLGYQSRPYWAYYYTGRYQDLIGLADRTLETADAPVLEESFYWRALAREAMGDEPGAIADLQESLRLNPNFSAGSYQLKRIQGGF